MSKIFLHIISISIMLLFSCNTSKIPSKSTQLNALNIKGDRIIERADEILQQSPTPLTMFSCVRSKGSIHDFYSEGDYWWPNPEDPDGP